MNEYILVEFHDSREVIIDGNPSGSMTGEVIEIEAGSHIITLDGADDYSPSKQKISPSETSPIMPLTVKFKKEQ